MENNKSGANGHSCIEITDQKFLDFINIQKPRTARAYKCAFRKLSEFDANINGQTMLDNKERWEQQTIFEFQKFLQTCKISANSTKLISANTIKLYTGAIRGFFSSNRRPLNFTRQEQRKINNGGRSSEDYLFSRDELKTLWNLADLQEKWILCNKSLGMRIEDFGKITYGHLRSIDLTQDPAFLGKWLTTKEGVYAYPFLDSDAIKVALELLSINKDKPDNARIFKNSNEQASYKLQQLVKKAKFQTANKTVRFHNLRKFATNILMGHMSELKANLIIGHANSSSDNAYINTDDLKQLFSKAEPDLLLNGNGQIKAIKKEVENQGSTIETLVKLLSAKDSEIAQLKAMIEMQTKTSQEIMGRLDYIEKATKTKKPYFDQMR